MQKKELTGGDEWPGLESNERSCGTLRGEEYVAGPAPTPAIHGLKAPCFRGKNASAGPVLGLTGGLFLIRYTLDYQLHLTPQKQRALEPGGDRDEAEEGVVIPNECPRVYIQMHTVFLITRRRDAAPHRLPPALRAHPAAPSPPSAHAFFARTLLSYYSPPHRGCTCTRMQSPLRAPVRHRPPPVSFPPPRRGALVHPHPDLPPRLLRYVVCMRMHPVAPPPFIAAPLIARAINPEDLSFTRI
ncbi:hypothetical protein DFH09DRAFT_1324038 [Mycena vulgaris]|nr:hypothetical protein DFH09DRAFT_1324038 [Mycena vulgaris]